MDCAFMYIIIIIIIIRDSVRIDGTGAASIMEVSFQDIPVTEEQDNQSELKVDIVL